MGSFIKLYRHLLKNHPIIIQSTQTGILMVSGDVLAQTVIERKSINKIDLKRTSQFGVMGVFLVGPTLTAWYRILSRTFGDVGKTVVLKKVALDQCVFAPVFIGIFLTSLGFLQGKQIDGISKDMKNNYKDILINNYKLWPCVQLCNFYLIPLNYQVLVVQSVAILWNTYLSFKTQST